VGSFHDGNVCSFVRSFVYRLKCSEVKTVRKNSRSPKPKLY